MNTNEAKQIRIEEYLHSLGYDPVRRQGRKFMVQVTVQGRAGAVLQGQHGTQSMVRFWRGQGREHHRTGAGALRVRQPALSLGKDSGAGARRAPGLLFFWRAGTLKTELPTVGGDAAIFPALYSYLRQRGINTELAKRECREVRYLTDGKPYFAVGFPNRSGGYEIRNKLFKGCIAPKDITHIRQEQPKETFCLFEGLHGLPLLPHPAAGKVSGAPRP